MIDDTPPDHRQAACPPPFVCEKAIRLEERMDQAEDSLRRGAARFAAIDNVVRPKPIEWWKAGLAILTLLGTLGIVGAIILRAPTREEFRELQRDVQAIREQQAATTIMLQSLITHQRREP